MIQCINTFIYLHIFLYNGIGEYSILIGLWSGGVYFCERPGFEVVPTKAYVNAASDVGTYYCPHNAGIACTFSRIKCPNMHFNGDDNSFGLDLLWLYQR